MNKKNEQDPKELEWIELFFRWLSEFTLTLIKDVWARRIVAAGIILFGAGCAFAFSYKVATLLNLFKS
jgi:hypothetical protein